MLGRLSPPLPTTSISHNQMATAVPTRRVCQPCFGQVFFDSGGCVDFTRGSSGVADSVAEDYSVVAAARRTCWDDRRTFPRCNVFSSTSSAVEDQGQIIGFMWSFSNGSGIRFGTGRIQRTSYHLQSNVEYCANSNYTVV